MDIMGTNSYRAHRDSKSSTNYKRKNFQGGFDAAIHPQNFAASRQEMVLDETLPERAEEVEQERVETGEELGAAIAERFVEFEDVAKKSEPEWVSEPLESRSQMGNVMPPTASWPRDTYNPQLGCMGCPSASEPEVSVNWRRVAAGGVAFATLGFFLGYFYKSRR